MGTCGIAVEIGLTTDLEQQCALGSANVDSAWDLGTEGLGRKASFR